MVHTIKANSFIDKRDFFVMYNQKEYLMVHNIHTNGKRYKNTTHVDRYFYHETEGVTF